MSTLASLTHAPTTPCACPLCGVASATIILVEAKRRFLRCPECTLIFVHPADRLRPLEEALRYLHHQNHRDDPGYVQFLERLVIPVCDIVPEGSRGLDFGCGPAPVIAELLTARERPAVSYDPLFFADDDLLHDQYDFLTCSEVIEHVHDPATMLANFGTLVRPGGTIAIMTRFYVVDTPFDQWWYRRDPTHVCFFNEDTMRWIAGRFGWDLRLLPNIALFGC